MLGAKLLGDEARIPEMAKKQSPHAPAESAAPPQSETSSHLWPIINQYTLPSPFEKHYSLITPL